MSIVKNNETYADMKSYIENNEGVSFGDVVQNCIKPALESIFGSLKYAVDTQGYPCVILPSSNGQISTTYAPCLLIQAKATDIPANNNILIKVGIMDVRNLATTVVDQPFEQNTSNGNNTGGTAVTVSFTTSGLLFNAMDIDRGYQFGFYGNIATYGSILCASMGCKVLKGKEVFNAKETDILAVQGYGTDSNNQLRLIYYRPSTDSIIYNVLRGWELPTQSTCANMYELNDGVITIDDYYVCFPWYQQILAPLCVFKVGETPYNMWSKEVTINGSKFSIAINPGNGNSGFTRIAIAKKVK